MPPSSDETERLAALLRYELLDSPSEAEFDELAQLAAQICGTPIALISMVDSARQWFKSRVNFNDTETPRDISFCSHAIQSSEIFEIPDATCDPRFRNNPLVIGSPHIAFYAGAPLVSHDGFRIGTLCVIDHVPKHLTHIQRDALATLSKQAMRLIEHQAITRELKKKQLELTTITDASPLGMFRTNARHDCVYINKKCKEITGLEFEQFAGRGWLAAIHPADLERLVAAIESAATRLTEFLSIQRFVRPDGVVRLCCFAGAPIIENDLFIGFAATVEDITERQCLIDGLAESETRLRTITDNLPVLITYVDKEQRVRFANATLEAWMGIAPALARNRRFEDVFGNALYAERRQYIARALSGERVEFDITSVASGVERHLRAIYIPDIAQNGAIDGFYTLTTDVTKMKRSEQNLAKLVRIDALTQLPNRYSLNEFLNNAVAGCKTASTKLAILYLDIDYFKAINDTHGHQVGDAVLVEFAVRLRECVREQDVVARLSGDEFIVVIEDTSDPEEPALLAKRIQEITKRAWQVGGQILQVSASIGIAFDYPEDPNAADLIANADKSLYEAKRNTSTR